MTSRILAAALAGGLFVTPVAAGDTPPRVFVLDPEGLTLSALALDSGAVLGKATLEGKPEKALMSPDGSRIVVLDRGPGKHTMRFGYHPTGKSWATVIDATSLGVVARAELCWNAEPQASFFSKGRLTVACSGYQSQKPQETLPRELVALDIATGQVAGRAPLERPMDFVEPLGDERGIVVFSGKEAPKNKPAVPAQVRFYDVELRLQGTVTLDGDPGRPVVSPDRAFVYLLERGKPDKKAEKNINGRVQVVSTAERAHVTNLDAGRDPRGLVKDEEGNQLFVLAEGTPSPEKPGEIPGVLTVIRGADVAATVPVGAEPLFLRVSPDRERLFVVSEKTLTSVDLPALSRLAGGTLKPAGISLASTAGGSSTVNELAVTGDRKRAYVLYANSSKLGVVDLDELKLVAEITTGRGGVKFGKLLAAVAMTTASYYAGYSGASYSGSPIFYYQVYGVAPANTSLALTEDEKHAYVLNTQSNDVTIVDTYTKEAVTKIGVGGQANRLELLPGGAYVAVTTGLDTLHLIDTRTRTKTSELPDGGNYVHSPDRRYAAAIGRAVVYCLEGASLKTLGKATGFKAPTQLLFPPG